jgi:hypothetical protein
MAHPNLATTLGMLGPSRFADRTIHIPFDKIDYITSTSGITITLPQSLIAFLVLFLALT